MWWLEAVGGIAIQEIMGFSILGEGQVSTNSLPWTSKRQIGLFRTLIQSVPWETALKNKGALTGWKYLKKEILKAQLQFVPMCQKMSLWGRRPAWLSRELSQELKEKGNVSPLEKGLGHSKGA